MVRKTREEEKGGSRADDRVPRCQPRLPGECTCTRIHGLAPQLRTDRGKGHDADHCLHGQNKEVRQRHRAPMTPCTRTLLWARNRHLRHSSRFMSSVLTTMENRGALGSLS